MTKMTFTACDLCEPIRISEYLKSRLGFTSALITKVKFGGVFIDGVPVHMRATVVNGSLIEVVFPEEASEGIEPMDIDVEVVYEDEYILAVNKPRGMPTHPSKGNHLPTLANAIMGKYGGNFVFRAINRLDRDTSGIVLIAKDPFSAARLSEYMREHHLDKRYLAKLKGVPKKKHGIIETNIEREYEGSIKRVVRDDGKYAKTEYTVLEDNGDSSVCGIKLYTGRTHQIRVHMAYIGHPLVNDFLYGVNEEGECYKLHCSSITFLHPITNAPVTVTADCDFYK